MPYTGEQLYKKVATLRNMNQDAAIDRSRVRDILNGGQNGVKALLGEKSSLEFSELPAPNLMLSALDRFAQKLGRSPDLKIDVFNEKDSERSKKKAEKALKKSEKETSSMVTYYVEKQEVL